MLLARRSTTPPPPYQPAVPHFDEETSQEFAGEAKYLDSKTDQKELLRAYPELKLNEMVHPVGSFDNSDIIAMAHYPTYTTKRSINDQSIANLTNPCIKWIDDNISTLKAGDIFPFNYCPGRLKRKGADDPVVRRTFGSDGTEVMDRSFIRKWSRSKAKIGIIFGKGNAVRYKSLFSAVPNRSGRLPICLSQQKMYYEEVHAYIELDDAGDAYRITFLVYHPEAHIIDSIPFAAREIRRRIGTGSGSLDDFVVITRSDRPVDTSTQDLTPTGLVDFVVSKFMLLEAQLGIQLTEDDVPTDLRPHIAFSLPFELDYNLNDCELPFGKCALVVYLIARFDRQGIPLPNHLRSLPPNILAILRGPLLYPAQSVLMPVLLFALSQLGDVAKKRLTEKLLKTWTTMVWDEMKILFSNQPELFMTHENFPVRPRLGAHSLWPNIRVLCFREVSAYRLDNTNDLALLELVKKHHYNIQRIHFRRKDRPVGPKGSRRKHRGYIPEAWAWGQGAGLGEAFNAVEILKLMASPYEKMQEPDGKEKEPRFLKSII
ncbi:hypothetical protein LTR97_011067 [Elasticomyces elasticus]|uniref:Uncharacterized protein n=1 Tax=Elasticomyces elasticus TaxID=574655 RepID=A0AAN7VZ90_9PEZI|nr:hypothetical protein LTR97_011067 [Elasticomyces elasticus]